jgi:hypothetical protein
MWRLALALVAVGLVAGAAGAAAPAPTPTRTEARSALAKAIEDEQFALGRLRRTPPRWTTAFNRLYGVADRLWPVIRYASTVGAAQTERDLETVRQHDWYAEDQVLRALGERPYDLDEAIRRLEAALKLKRAALETLRTAAAPAATPQCADGKDNDRDGTTDWALDAGCTSDRDIRESSRFTCNLGTAMRAGRLAVTGECSGPFAQLEATPLDGVQLNGRFDVKHATGCAAPRPTAFRCTTKPAAQNPRHLVDLRIATTSRSRRQRLRLRFFDSRRRQVASVVLPRAGADR